MKSYSKIKNWNWKYKIEKDKKEKLMIDEMIITQDQQSVNFQIFLVLLFFSLL